MTMSAFDKEYFFLFRPDDAYLPSLTPSTDTAKKGITYKAQPLGSKPFIFYNNLIDRQVERNTIPDDLPPDVLFDGSNPLVNDRIKKKLANLEIPNLAIQASIYIDHNKKWHENYWYLTFTKLFDCWDREKSSYDPDPISIDPPSYSVFTYSLNDKLLEETPLPARLLFQIGGTMRDFVIVHESIADLFRVKGVDVVPITDFGVTYPE
jgi:hypothetical protein